MSKNDLIRDNLRPGSAILSQAVPCRPTLVISLLIMVQCLSSLATGQTTDKGQDLGQDFQPYPATGLTANDVAQGWIALFDGETLYGWKPQQDTHTDWQVNEGTIQASRGDASLLRTTSQFDDFELRLEFKCPNSTNSGVFLRTSPQPKNPAGDCYELNIADGNNPFPTGSLVARQKVEPGQPVVEPGWNQMHVMARSNRITASINGVQVMDYVDKRPLGKGYIGLQFNSGPIAFRKIHLKPIGLEPLIDPDLGKWNTDQLLASRSTVQPGDPPVMNLRGGKGQLETRRSYADFVFQLECKTLAPGLNSGLFFRCIPGELMNGYESQIQNQYKDQRRDQPVDCGTGGIFRRTTARQIVSDDLAWFSKTIVASGPHVSVWVNGYQVTDWSDQRAPDPNPRKGRRLAAGTLILQGHDPTTDIDFRNIRVREISERRP